MLEHRAPLGNFAGPRDSHAPDFLLTALADRNHWLLQADRDRLLLEDGLVRDYGLRLPAPGTVTSDGTTSLLWLGPCEWLLQLPRDGVFAAAAMLRPGPRDALVAVTDVSDAFGSFELGGARAAEVLATACSLDFRSFPPGNVARTLVADVPAIVWKPKDAHCFRCLVDRSFAEHFRSSLAGSSLDASPLAGSLLAGSPLRW